MRKGKFDEAKIKFVDENIDECRRFVNGELSKPEHIGFSRKARLEIGYSKKTTSTVLKKMIGNAIDEVRYLELVKDF